MIICGPQIFMCLAISWSDTVISWMLLSLQGCRNSVSSAQCFDVVSLLHKLQLVVFTFQPLNRRTEQDILFKYHPRKMF